MTKEDVPVQQDGQQPDAPPQATPSGPVPEQVSEQPAAALEPPARPKRGRPPGSSARKTRTVELTLTVTGTMDGDWQADLMHAGQRVLQGVSVPATAVARAAKELHPDVSEAIDSVLETAREQHRARVEELQVELERAQRALAGLTEG